MAIEIKKIIDDLAAMKLLKTVKRQSLRYNMDVAREVVLAIGRERNEKFSIDTDNAFAYLNFIKWVMGDPTMVALHPDSLTQIPGRLDAGIYIAGNTGTGKSWLLEIMSMLCHVDNPHITLGETTRPLRWQNIRADQICDEYTTTGNITRYKSMPILGIQDLGSEPTESLYMGNRLPVLGSIIESRGDRTDLVTIISSNLPINSDALRAKYGDRVASRLGQMCNYMIIQGRDRRKEL